MKGGKQATYLIHAPAYNYSAPQSRTHTHTHALLHSTHDIALPNSRTSDAMPTRTHALGLHSTLSVSLCRFSSLAALILQRLIITVTRSTTLLSLLRSLLYMLSSFQNNNMHFSSFPHLYINSHSIMNLFL